MKKLLSLFLTATMLLAAQPSLLIKGVAKGIHPLPIESLSQESGGSLTAEQAYSDGVGVMMIDPVGIKTTDYSTLNSLVLKYGSKAASSGLPLRDYVLTVGNVDDKAKAELLALSYHDGDACDDGDALTTGETYLSGVCQGGVIPDGTACDDGDINTFDTTYLAGICQGGFVNGDFCDDGDATTSGDAYVNGVCVGVDLSGELILHNGTLYCNGATPGITLVEGVNVPDVDNDGVIDTYYVASGVADIQTKIFTELFPANNICTSKVTDMTKMFYGKTTFNQEVSRWDTSNVTNMSYMFYNAYKFNNGDTAKLSNKPLNWNTSKVINMSNMFYYNFVFNQPIGNWDTSNVTDMNLMFHYAQYFNQDISNWDVRNVTIMRGIFSYAYYFQQDISSWCVIKIPNKPDIFSVSSLLDPLIEKHPVWGTCPSQ